MVKTIWVECCMDVRCANYGMNKELNACAEATPLFERVWKCDGMAHAQHDIR